MGNGQLVRVSFGKKLLVTGLVLKAYCAGLKIEYNCFRSLKKISGYKVLVFVQFLGTIIALKKYRAA